MTGLHGILPDVFGHRDHPSQALGPPAFRRTQTFPPPFVRRFRDHAVHHDTPLRGIQENAAHHISKTGLGQTTFDGIIQIEEGGYRPPQNFSNMAWFQHIGITVPLQWGSNDSNVVDTG